MTYSYLRAEGTPADRELLTAPYMGLQIAGEATWAEAPGTMHGAWFSGVRAADRIITRNDHAAKAPDPDPTGAVSCDVVVVGAGLAGLAAARRLTESGRTVVVLEAGPAALGRARGLNTPFGDFAVGGMWLHGAAEHPLLPFVRAAGIDLVPDVWAVGDGDPLGVTSPVFTEAGLLDHMTHVSEVERFRSIERELAGVTGRDRVLAANLTPLLAPLDAGARRLQETWFRTLYEGLVAGSFDDLSTINRYERFMLDGEDMMLTAPLSRAEPLLVEGLDLRFDTRVTDVVYDRGRWRVSAGAGERFSAPSVVLTTALAPLERLSIRPPLPRATRRALSRIGRGRGGKFFAIFEEAFWTPLRSFFVALPGDSLARVFADVGEIQGRPALAGFTTFTATDRLESLPQSELCGEVADLLAPVARWSRSRRSGSGDGTPVEVRSR